jgi:anti-sigma regulatory factor (Ser/Thr protein kinase)
MQSAFDPRIGVALDSTTHTWLFRIPRDRAAVSSFCAGMVRRLPPDYASADLLHALQVSFDELLTNVVMHAGGPADEAIEVLLRRAEHGVEAVIRYRAPAWDPTRATPPALDADLHARAPGGVGLHLVRELMQRFEYRHVDGWNEVLLERAR